MKKDSNIVPAPFRFKNFHITQCSISLNPETKANDIHIDIEPKGRIFEESKVFEIQLSITLKSDDGLDASVVIHGIFEFKEVQVAESLGNYFYINAPAIIFPYLRSYISALTALSGCRTIILPPMNMTSLGEKLKKNTEKSS